MYSIRGFSARSETRNENVRTAVYQEDRGRQLPSPASVRMHRNGHCSGPLSQRNVSI
jgi:hypothetical protein